MADALSGASLSFYGNRLQMWGLGNSGINTQDLIDVELAMLEMKSYPIESQMGYYQQELKHWQSLKSEMLKFQTISEKLKDLSNANKGVTLSQEGFASVTANKGAIETNYTLEISSLAKSHKILSDSMGDSTVALQKDGTVKINGKDFTFTEDMSLNDVVTKLNEGDYKVNASVINGTLVLTAKQTGEANKISLEDNNGLLEGMGLLTSTGAFKNEIQRAEDAVAYIDGVEVKSANNTLSDVITGVTINLNKETTSPVSFTINQNQTAVKETVREFVSSYNKAIMTINQYTGKGAALQGKTIATQAKSSLNRALTQPTNSSLFMYQLGIELDGVLRDGTVRFDESKLNEQLDKNYDEVFKLLVGENSFSTHIFETMDKLTKESGSLNTKISGIEKSIENLQDTLDKYAQSYERQRESILTKYARYESMMASLNIQQQFMAAQLDALSGNKKD